MSLYDIGAQVARQYYRHQREQHEWVDDMLTSALAARMLVASVDAEPLDHPYARDRFGLRQSDGMAVSIVLCGGHVYARREWRSHSIA